MSEQYLNEPDAFIEFLASRIAQLEDEIKEMKMGDIDTIRSKPVEPVVEETVDEIPQEIFEQQLPTRAVPYAPIPTSWTVSHGTTTDNDPVVILTVQTPIGDAVYFVMPDIGRQIGEALIQMSANAEEAATQESVTE